MVTGAPQPIFILGRRNLPVRVDSRCTSLVGETYMKLLVQSVLLAVWIFGWLSIASVISVASKTVKIRASQAQQPLSAGPEDEEKIKPLIVMIESIFPDEVKFIGAGIIIGSDTSRLYIATANHLVRNGAPPDRHNAQNVRVKFKWIPGDPIEARLLEFENAELDLAVLAVTNVDSLRIPGSSLFDQLGDSSDRSLKRGDDVYSI